MSTSKVDSTESSKKKEISLDDDSLDPLIVEYMTSDTLKAVLVFRFINALSVITFFQPDEYFQSLEPAWQMAFGAQSGAWITWEWHNQLRSSLHPAIFAILYFVFDKPMELLEFYPQFRGMIMVAIPPLLQGLCAAVGDFYTWKLAQHVYGRGSNTAWAALMLSILSPWQWFCSTRTLSNCLETTLTIVALNYWPWDLGSVISPAKNQAVKAGDDKIKTLRWSLLCAGFACILRPTNLFVWASLITVSIVSSKTLSDNISSYLVLLRETILCGSLVLAVSATSDYFYYGSWTFPPYQWLYFNLTQSLAVFYGSNDWHYYISQGIPQLLTTYLPWGVLAMISSTSLSSNTLPAKTTTIRYHLAFMILTMITTLSLISHKEVRFIYPLLPSLHILLAPHILSFLSPPPELISTTTSNHITTILTPIAPLSFSKLKLLPILLLNIGVAYYTTRVHQSGVISVLSFLREEYALTHMNYRGELHDNATAISSPDNPFVAFLMPCHSTPWRSHLVYPSLTAWALTCSPPLHIPASSPARASYLDEADRFFLDQKSFLTNEVGSSKEGRKWPRLIVGFENSLNATALNEVWVEVGGKGEWEVVWRGFNSHWIDDARRGGDVVVWSLDGAAQRVERKFLREGGGWWGGGAMD